MLASISMTGSILYSDWVQDDEGNWTLDDTSSQESVSVDTGANATINAEGSWTVGTEEEPSESSILSFSWVDGDSNFTNLGDITVYSDSSSVLGIINAPFTSVILGEGSSTNLYTSGDTVWGISWADNLTLNGDLLLRNSHQGGIVNGFFSNFETVAAQISGSVTVSNQIESSLGFFFPFCAGIRVDSSLSMTNGISGIVRADTNLESVLVGSYYFINNWGVYATSIESGDVSGSVISNVNVGNVLGGLNIESYALKILSGDCEINDISGEIASNVNVSNSGLGVSINSYGIRGAGGDIIIGDVTGSITSNVDIDLLTENLSVTSCSIESEFDCDIGNVSGDIISSVTVTETDAAETVIINGYGVYSVLGNLDIGDVSGNILSTISMNGAVETFTVKNFAVLVQNIELVVGDISGKISSIITATSADSARVTSRGLNGAGDGDIGSISGEVTSSVSVDSLNGDSTVSSMAITTSDFSNDGSSLITTIGDITGTVVSSITLGQATSEESSLSQNLTSAGIFSPLAESLTIGTISGTVSSSAISSGITYSYEDGYGSVLNNIYSYGIHSYGELVIGGISGSVSSTISQGDISGSGYTYISFNNYGIAALGEVEDDDSSLGGIEGSVTASTAVGDVIVEDGMVTLNNSNFALYMPHVSSLTIDALSGDVTSSYSVGAITTSGENGGPISSTSSFYGIYSLTETGIESISGTINASISEGALVSASYVNEILSSHAVYFYDNDSETENTTTLGDLSGTISASVDRGNLASVAGSNYSRLYAYGIQGSGEAISIGKLSGSISASIMAGTTTMEGSDYSTFSSSLYGIQNNGDVSLDDISGSISVSSMLGDVVISTVASEDYSGYNDKVCNFNSYLIYGGEIQTGDIAGTVSSSFTVGSIIMTGVDANHWSYNHIYVNNYGLEAREAVIGSISGSITIDGNIGDLTLSQSTENTSCTNIVAVRNIVFDNSSLTIGDINGTLVASSVVGDVNLSGDVDYSKSYVMSYVADSNEVTIGDISGSLTATTIVGDINVSGDTARSSITSVVIDGDESVSLGHVSGTLSSSVIVGNVTIGDRSEEEVLTSFHVTSGVIDTEDLTIADFSGTISATAQTETVEEGEDVITLDEDTIIVFGLIANKSITFTSGSCAGDITVNANIEGESKSHAVGVGTSSISGDLDGTITVSSDDIAVGVFLLDEMESVVGGEIEEESTPEEITVNGTIVATGAEDSTYAIYAGSVEYIENDNGNVTDLNLVAGDDDQIVNLGTTSSITGMIDLTGGDDIINFIATENSDAEGYFDTDLMANVEAMNVLSGVWQLGGTYDMIALAIDGGTLHVVSDLDVEGLTHETGTLWVSEGTLSNVPTVDSGTLRVSGTGTWTDVVELDGGTLRLEREYTLNEENITLTSGVVDFDADATLTWELSTLSEGQSLVFNTGLLLPTTDITIDGGLFNWQSGDVDLNYHTISGVDITIPENSMLYGIGSINGSVINNGMVRPGYSPGTISISGDFTQSDTGILIMEIADQDFDVLSVSGTVTLAGTLDLTADLLQNDVDYTLISSPNAIIVDEDSFVVDDGKATREVNWSLSDGDTEFHFEINHVNYTNFSENAGQISIATTLDEVYGAVDTDSMLGQLIMTVDNFELDASVTKFLSGLAAPMSMNTGWLIEQGTDVMNLIKDQQSQIPSGSYTWVKGIYGDINFDAYGNYGERGGDYHGAIAGVTMGLGDSGWNLGGAVSSVDGNMDGLSQYDNETTSFWLVASNYTPSENGGWNNAIRLGLGCSNVDVDAYDRFFFSGDHINSSYEGDTLSAFAEYALNKQFGKWIVEPSIGLTYQRHSDDAHDDILDGEVLRSWEEVTSKSLKGSLGGRAMYPITLETAKLIPYVNLRLEYEFEDAPEGKYTWGGTSISGILTSAEWDELTVRMGAGFIYSMNNGWSTSLSGDYLQGDEHDSYGVNAGVSYSF
jgi:hypothetical protein